MIKLNTPEASKAQTLVMKRKSIIPDDDDDV
jgi:hypothetical protein